MALHRDGRPLSTNGSISPGWLGRDRVVIVLLQILMLVGGGLLPGRASAQDEPQAGAVVVVPIRGAIDLGVAPFLSRALDEAAAAGAAAVLLEIDTPGGRLDAVLGMQDALLDSPVRTIAYVNRTAFSAGALIAIACEEIYMPPGAAMGAATPVDGATGETASEKVVSAVRTTFKTTAEARGRDPQVAEAMVDPTVVIPGLDTGGELLTLTTDEAIRWGYADGVVASRAEALAAAGLAEAPVVEVEPSLAERLVRIITEPLLSSLLIILALLLIIGDFFVEGFGLAGAAGIALLGLFFWGHLLAGLAGWEDVALVALGLGLIAIELLIVPGFGVPGILGLAALGGGLFLALIGRDFQFQAPELITRAALTVAVSLLVVIAGIVAVLALLPRSRRLSGLMLQPAAEGGSRTPASTAGWLRWFGGATVTPPAAGARPETQTMARPADSIADQPVTAADEPTLAGAAGIAITDLRPSGVAEINGRRVDVVSGGEYIPAGAPIAVIADERYRRVVRRADGHALD